MKNKLYRLSAIIIILTNGFSACAQDAGWKGKITYSYGEELKVYDFALKTDRSVLKSAWQAFVTPSGEIYFIDMRYLTRNRLVRKSNSSFIQLKNVIDLSNDNPIYKERLENYSFIRGTGNSGVISAVGYPQVSPNGKYLSVTIFGYQGLIYDKNCVVVFDIASGEELARFDEKYGASWTKEGGLLMAGSYKSTSVEGNEYHSKTPGIFVTTADFKTVKRIDPDLDDPAPYHPSLSPDGKKVAFILNNHVWLMDTDGRNLKQLTDVDNDNIETFPVWSPDGNYIACWSYKTFEKSYFTAIAIIPSNTPEPIALSNTAKIWPRDVKNFRISSGGMQISWK